MTIDTPNTDDFDDEEQERQNDPLMSRISCDPARFAGKPHLKEAGVTVRVILEDLGYGRTIDDLFERYITLTKDDIQAALLYAAWKIGGTYPGETISR